MNNTEKLPPATGRILVSEPSLSEPHFNHSVIYLVDYNQDSETLGIVLNRATPFTLDRAINGVRTGIGIPVFAGGPVGNDRLIYIHTLGPLIRNSREISNGIFLGGELDDVLDYVNSGCDIEGNLRFFIGYSGWSRGQLEDELKAGSWVVSNPLKPSVMLSQTDNTLWHTAVRALGDDYRDWCYSPLYPHLN